MIHTLLFPITMYVCKCWTVKKTDRRKKKKLVHLKFGVGGDLYGYPRSPKDKQVGPKAFQPEIWLEAKMTKLRLCYFKQITWQVLWKRQ